jgi:hypothetical protein
VSEVCAYDCRPANPVAVALLAGAPPPPRAAAAFDSRPPSRAPRRRRRPVCNVVKNSTPVPRTGPYSTSSS